MIQVQRVGNVMVLKPQAALVGECLQACRRQLNETIAGRKTRLVIDLSETLLIQSEGLEFLIESQQACLQQGGRLSLASASELCREILDICGLSTRITMFQDLRTALADYAR